MKKIISAFLFILLLLNLSSCQIGTNNSSSTSDITFSTPNNTMETTSKYNTDDERKNALSYFSTLDILYKQGENYKIFTDSVQSGYYYYVTDNNGRNIDIGYHSYRGSFGFSTKDNILIMEYGHGGSAWDERYYDVTTGRVSRFFEKPIAKSKELVAYFSLKDGKILLVVQNMFDPAKYYKEITRDFSDFVIKDHCTAEFIDNNTKLDITYWVNPNDEKITETIDLTD
ncbi:MAG: hypothetical protein IJF54_04945 [Clostridia bacterium]|nr:hypothetical protein [Clostridia bacterium]